MFGVRPDAQGRIAIENQLKHAALTAANTSLLADHAGLMAEIEWMQADKERLQEKGFRAMMDAGLDEMTSLSVDCDNLCYAIQNPEMKCSLSSSVFKRDHNTQRYLEIMSSNDVQRAQNKVMEGLVLQRRKDAADIAAENAAADASFAFSVPWYDVMLPKSNIFGHSW